jgi:hypothetical protein
MNTVNYSNVLDITYLNHFQDVVRRNFGFL